MYTLIVPEFAVLSLIVWKVVYSCLNRRVWKQLFHQESKVKNFVPH